MAAIQHSASTLASVVLLLFAISQVNCTFSVVLNGIHHIADNVVVRDVCIIGGGSSGTYAAIELSDSGKDVIVVEQKSRLGGHTETYTDLITGTKMDQGVLMWHNTTTVRDYFQRLTVSLTQMQYHTVGTLYIDFQTGQVDSEHTPTNTTALGEALTAYGAELAKYPYVEDGFILPYPVPSDLLLSWGDFVTKHNLQGMMDFHLQFAQGMGDIFAKPTLYIMKNFGIGVLQGIETGFLTTAQHDNSLLYEHAQTVLGKDNVLFNSTILAVERAENDDCKVQVLVQTASGTTLIKSNQLIVSIPPKLNNLEGWDLSKEERSVFSQFNNTGYCNGIVRNSGIPANLTITNVSPDTIYNHAVLPGIYTIGPTHPPAAGLINVEFGSAEGLLSDEVQKQIVADIKRLSFNGKGESETEFAAFTNHAPFELNVPAEAIAAGFYSRLYSLQGQQNTWYTGAAFHTQDSSLLWKFTKSIVANMTKAVDRTPKFAPRDH